MSKFDAFNLTTATYKTVGEHPILADIMIPKNVPAGAHPLIVRFHGGGLVSSLPILSQPCHAHSSFQVNGSRYAELFFPAWLLDYAHADSAIVVSADYRMMPESSG